VDFDQVWRYRIYVRQKLIERGRPAEDLRILARRLGRLLGPTINCRFHWNPTPTLGREHMIMTGLYDYHQNGGTSSIWINTHPDTRVYHWGQGDNITWMKFVCDLSECVMHEMVHHLQHQARHGYEPWVVEYYDDPDKNYYTDPDEIDAYAWSWVSECMDQQGLETLRWPSNESVWWNYAEQFEAGDPVRRRLLKKAYARLIQAIERQQP
jgi:hypothetical protein